MSKLFPETREELEAEAKWYREFLAPFQRDCKNEPVARWAEEEAKKIEEQLRCLTPTN